MPLPSTPAEVDGVGLSTDQAEWLRRAVRMIYRVDPGRAAGAILTQATAAFRKAYQRRDGAWVALPVVDLAGGAVLRRRGALPAE